jgi:hypothetical protein
MARRISLTIRVVRDGKDAKARGVLPWVLPSEMLLSKQGYPVAEVAERLGDTKVVTAEHYLFALGDYSEVDYSALLAA